MNRAVILKRLVVDAGYRPLPEDARELCECVRASPRLVAHLTLVHDAACVLSAKLRAAFPSFAFDEERVLFGAATHDLGKAQASAELVSAGESHQAAGLALLRRLGVPEDRARFAWTHGNGHWDEPGIENEDLVVALADKIWKGKRVAKLERLVVKAVASASGKKPWDVFAELDEILESVAANADARLAWQTQFSVD